MNKLNEEFKYLRGKEIQSIFIPGRIRCGKTSLAHRLCDFYHEETNRPVYVFRHPRQELIEELGYLPIDSLEELQELQDAIVWIDEWQLNIPVYDHKANTTLQRILSLAGQRNILLIISTSETRVVTRGVEAYVDAFFVKDLEVDLVKQGSMIKKIIKENVMFDVKGFRLAKNEYLFYCRNMPHTTGKYVYSLPLYWSSEYSCPYRTKIVYESALQKEGF